jgi:hypothetical protein
MLLRGMILSDSGVVSTEPAPGNIWGNEWLEREILYADSRKEIKNWSDSGLYLVKNNNGVYLTIWSDRMSKQTQNIKPYFYAVKREYHPVSWHTPGSAFSGGLSNCKQWGKNRDR